MSLEGYFGGCPECERCDGLRNMGRVHWAVCHEHRVKWLIGENLFSGWIEQTSEERARDEALLGGYRQVFGAAV